MLNLLQHLGSLRLIFWQGPRAATFQTINNSYYSWKNSAVAIGETLLRLFSSHPLNVLPCNKTGLNWVHWVFTLSLSLSPTSTITDCFHIDTFSSEQSWHYWAHSNVTSSWELQRFGMFITISGEFADNRSIPNLRDDKILMLMGREGLKWHFKPVMHAAAALKGEFRHF